MKTKQLPITLLSLMSIVMYGQDTTYVDEYGSGVKIRELAKAIISFFNNGSCKVMTVSAETVTANGVIGAYNR